MPYDTIYPWITSRLQSLATGVANSTFDPDIAAVIRSLLSEYPGVTYESLSGDDELNFDQAVGLMVAAKLQPSYATRGSGAANVAVKSASGSSISQSFSENASAMVKGWMEDAWAAFGLVSFVKAAKPSLEMFALAGRRRSAEDDPPTNIYDQAFGEG